MLGCIHLMNTSSLVFSICDSVMYLAKNCRCGRDFRSPSLPKGITRVCSLRMLYPAFRMV